MTEALHQFLRTRRSIRQFKAGPIAKSIIKRMLETATYAPSAHGLQPWRFVVVTSPDGRKRLAEAVTGKFRLDMTRNGAPEAEIEDRIARTNRRIGDAPVIVILCRDVTRIHPQPDEFTRQAEETMGRQSVAVAGLQLLLAAHAEGLGGTWICWPLFAPTEITSALDLSTDWEPQGMVFIGRADEQPEASKRASLPEVVKYI
jgi:F420 biosynthesis protein FbiB-like protein